MNCPHCGVEFHPEDMSDLIPRIPGRGRFCGRAVDGHVAKLMGDWAAALV